METFVKDINAKLLGAQHAYYVLAAPIMTDAEYDTLEAQLKGAVAANPDLAEFATALNAVGSDIEDSPLTSMLRTVVPNPAALDAAMDNLNAQASVSTGRIKHVRPMLSIENQYTKDDVVKFFKELQGTPD
jgi:NAD-dependent DNA ligase